MVCGRRADHFFESTSVGPPKPTRLQAVYEEVEVSGYFNIQEFCVDYIRSVRVGRIGREMAIPRKNLDATKMHEMMRGLMFSRFVSCMLRKTFVMLSHASKQRCIA